jgi:hypothetical protein
MPDPGALPNAHTLTLEFGRLLGEAEWRILIVEVRRLPYVRSLHVEEVCRGELVANPRRRSTTTI